MRERQQPFKMTFAGSNPEQAHDIAVNASDMEAASQILAEATMRWGGATTFWSSRLAKSHSEEWEGAAAW
jgi:hypothetical protein